MSISKRPFNKALVKLTRTTPMALNFLLGNALQLYKASLS